MWEFFHINLCQDPSHLVFCYPTLLPPHGILNYVVRELLWSNIPSLLGKQSWSKPISNHSTQPITRACPLSGEPENNICRTTKHELSNLSPSSNTWWCLVKSVSGVCSPSIPPLTSNGTTAYSTRKKAKCLTSVFASQCCVLNPSLSAPTLPNHTQLLLDSMSFAPEKEEKFLTTLNWFCNWIPHHQLTCSKNLFCCYWTSYHFLRSSFIWIQSRSLYLGASTPNMEALNVRHEIRIISQNISWAFDIAWNPTMLSQLSAYAIQGQLHSWVTGFRYCPSRNVALKGIL